MPDWAAAAGPTENVRWRRARAALLEAVARHPPRRRAHRACLRRPTVVSSTDRHRLNRGGDRQANRALHTIVLVRMCHDPRTRDYVARRTLEGLKTKDIFRCLKRFVAREVYHHLTNASSGTPGPSPTD